MIIIITLEERIYKENELVHLIGSKKQIAAYERIGRLCGGSAENFRNQLSRYCEYKRYKRRRYKIIKAYPYPIPQNLGFLTRDIFIYIVPKFMELLLEHEQLCVKPKDLSYMLNMYNERYQFYGRNRLMLATQHNFDIDVINYFFMYSTTKSNYYISRILDFFSKNEIITQQVQGTRGAHTINLCNRDNLLFVKEHFELLVQKEEKETKEVRQAYANLLIQQDKQKFTGELEKYNNLETEITELIQYLILEESTEVEKQFFEENKNITTVKTGKGTKRGSDSRHTTEYQDFVEAVLERDNRICQCCESTLNPEVHHILSFRNYPALRTEPTNGITLCECCHSAMILNGFHQIYGTYNNTKEQLQEYIDNKRQSLGLSPKTIDEKLLDKII